MFDGKKTAEALICFNRLVDVLESPYSKLAHSDSVLLMNAYTYSGRSNVILGNKAAAMKCYKAAAGIAERLGDRPQLGRLYNNLFAIYYSSREFDSASGLLDMSLELYKEAGDSAGMRNIYNNKGLVALEQADYEAVLATCGVPLATLLSTTGRPLRRYIPTWPRLISAKAAIRRLSVCSARP